MNSTTQSIITILHHLKEIKEYMYRNIKKMKGIELNLLNQALIFISLNYFQNSNLPSRVSFWIKNGGENYNEQ